MKNLKRFRNTSLRLKGYDYSNPGFYFITICTKNRESIFGEIVEDKMVLNENGYIAHDFWHEINNRYNICITHSFVVMPNHIHGIVEIVSKPKIHGQNSRRRMTLPLVIGWYKMNVSKRINILRGTSGFPIWQKDYYEHIIRDEESKYHISEYIRRNPEFWEKDRFR